MKYPRPHLGDALTRRRALTILGLTVPAVAAACTTVGSNQPEEAPSPGASLTFLPDDKAKDVNPTAPVSVTVTNGWFRDVKLVNADGKVVAGALSRDQTRFHTTEPLGFDVKYTWKGSAVGLDGKAVPVSGAFTTLVPTAKVNGQFQLADGQTVGIAAPVIIQFDAHIADKAAVERSLSISCDPPTEGGWAWLPDEAQGSRVHWRSREYFKAGTKVEVKANLYGIPFGDGAFGNEDMSLDFSVGRRQVVYADAQSHRIRVTTDEGTILDLPCSYGEETCPATSLAAEFTLSRRSTRTSGCPTRRPDTPTSTSASRSGFPTTASLFTPTLIPLGSKGIPMSPMGVSISPWVMRSPISAPPSTAILSR